MADDFNIGLNVDLNQQNLTNTIRSAARLVDRFVTGANRSLSDVGNTTNNIEQSTAANVENASSNNLVSNSLSELTDRVTDSIPGWSTLSRVLTGSTLAIGAAVAVVGALAIALDNLAQSQLKPTIELDNFASRLRVGTNELATITNAVRLAGLEFDDAAEGIKNVSESVAEAAIDMKGAKFDAFERIGLDVQELRSLSPEKQLLTVVTALEGLGNASERTLTALELGSEELSKLSAIANQNGKSFKDLIQISSEYTTVLTDGQIKAIRELNVEVQKSILINEKLGRETLAATAESSNMLSEAWNELKTEFSDSATLDSLVGLINLVKLGIVSLINITRGLFAVFDAALSPIVAIVKQLGGAFKIFAGVLIADSKLIQEGFKDIERAGLEMVDRLTFGFFGFSDGLKQAEAQAKELAQTQVEVSGVASDAWIESSKKTMDSFDGVLKKIKDGSIKAGEDVTKNILGETIESNGLVLEVDAETTEMMKKLSEARVAGEKDIEALEERFNQTQNVVDSVTGKIEKLKTRLKGTTDVDAKLKIVSEIKEMEDSLKRNTDLSDKFKTKLDEVNKSVADIKLQEENIYGPLADGDEELAKIVKGTQVAKASLQDFASGVNNDNLVESYKQVGERIKTIQDQIQKGEVSTKVGEAAVKLQEDIGKKILEQKRNREKDLKNISKQREKAEDRIEKIREKFGKLAEDRIKKENQKKIKSLEDVAARQRSLAESGIQGTQQGSFEDFLLTTSGNQASEAENTALTAATNEETRIEQSQVDKLKAEKNEELKQRDALIKSEQDLVKVNKDLADRISKLALDSNNDIVVTF